MAKQRTERGQAALVLESELTDITDCVEFASTMADDLLVEYFSRDPDQKDRDDLKTCLAYDYKRTAVKSRMICHLLDDALNKIRALLEEMENRIESEAEQ